MKRHQVPMWDVRLQVVCADVSGLLTKLNGHGIPLINIEKLDELTVSFCIPEDRYKSAVKLIEGLGGEISKRRLASGNLLFHSLFQRPMLIVGVLTVVFLTFYLPSRIMFVKVIGNERVTEQQIISAAADCGIHFGAVRHKIRSEKVKNRLLSEIPDLKWVGINTRGCLAEISVRERPLMDQETELPMVSSIVAARDGVIRQMTVTNGNPLCRVGQAVEKGQLLISGYSDCGRCIYGTRAEAEIYAQTRREFSANTPAKVLRRIGEGRCDKKIGLLLGKKRINFYKGSGISDTTCVRMYKEYPLTLPGGFQLPVALTVQREISCDVMIEKRSLQIAGPILQQYARSYLESQMIGGKVLQGDFQTTETQEVYRLTGQYICDEMIGQTRSEESVHHYEQTD